MQSIAPACGIHPFEAIVVDGASRDDSIFKASEAGAQIVPGRYGLLEARRLGSMISKGRFIALIDADQVLEPGSLSDAVDLMGQADCDMVALGERVFEPRTAFQRWADSDKLLLELNSDDQLDPDTGVLMPRVFRREVLLTAFDTIPKEADRIVIAMDHAMIYKATFAISDRVKFQTQAVRHREPETLVSVWIKNFRWGATTGRDFASGTNRSLVRSKYRRRNFKNGPMSLRIQSGLFLATKTLGFAPGFVWGVMMRYLGR